MPAPTKPDPAAAPVGCRTHRGLLALLLCLFTMPLAAHKSSDSYLTLRIATERIEGRWDIALRDLEVAIGLDDDEDGAITWGELKTKRGEVRDLAFSGLRLSLDGSFCPIEPKAFLVDEHSDGAYAVLEFDARCRSPAAQIEVAYALLFDLDPQHRGLVRITDSTQSHALVMSPARPRQTIRLNESQAQSTFLQYLNEGIRHIFLGYDHILFLLSLLLPVVLSREGRAWRPVDRFYPAGIEAAKIVTAFTLAHSITLSLAVLEVISIPARWVESAIAASVVLAALNNLGSWVRDRRWIVAFGFGLVHGLGFANVLEGLGLPRSAMVLSLLAFNLGVEIGQLAIVGMFLPLSYGLRRSRGYRIFGLGLGSLLIATFGLFWLIERALDIELPAFL